MENQEGHHKNLIEKICKVKISLGLTRKIGEQWKKAEVGYEAKVTEGDDVEQLENFLKERANLKLEECFREETADMDFDLNKIRWQPSEGKSGPFERSVDRRNPEFQKIVNALIEKRSMVIDNQFVWLFRDNKTLGKKPSR